MSDADMDAEVKAAKASLEAAQSVAQIPLDSWWSVTNAMTISTVVLGFGVIVILLATYLIKIGKSSESVLRIFGTTLIILVAVFLVVAGYTSEQIAPVMGLLGTIAGYLLGKDASGSHTPRASGTSD